MNKTQNSLLILITLFFVRTQVTAQCGSFNLSDDCQVNVFEKSENVPFNDIIRATFKYITPEGKCTGTLINQDVSSGQVRPIFITSRHCFKTGDECGGSWNFDNESTEITFLFNYQSATGSQDDVPLDNMGCVLNSSHFPPPGPNNGYRYLHRSPIRLLGSFKCIDGDIFMAEILETLPPHFNVHYAGWKTTQISPILDVPAIQTHHPRGDIKKISRATWVDHNQNPVEVGCRWVTKVIDVLFGWIWGRRFVLEKICNYTEDPFLTVKWTQYGKTEGGSSGSPLFNYNRRYLGTFSLGEELCSGGPAFARFGKFDRFYRHDDIRNALNPEHKWWTDQSGIQGRDIVCYPFLEDLHGEYYPANEYQPENEIVLRSESIISTTNDPNQRLRIYPNADFQFLAANEIQLNPGFSAEPGANFTAEINSGCVGYNGLSVKDSELPEMLSKYEEKAFNINEYQKLYLEPNGIKSKEVKRINISPNPSSGIFRISTTYSKKYTYKVLNATGQTLINQIVNQASFEIDLTNYDNGTYILIISNQSESHSKLLIKQ